METSKVPTTRKLFPLVRLKQIPKKDLDPYDAIVEAYILSVGLDPSNYFPPSSRSEKPEPEPEQEPITMRDAVVNATTQKNKPIIIYSHDKNGRLRDKYFEYYPVDVTTGITFLESLTKEIPDRYLYLVSCFATDYADQAIITKYCGKPFIGKIRECKQLRNNRNIYVKEVIIHSTETFAFK